jgi:hypothetical protein
MYLRYVHFASYPARSSDNSIEAGSDKILPRSPVTFENFLKKQICSHGNEIITTGQSGHIFQNQQRRTLSKILGGGGEYKLPPYDLILLLEVLDHHHNRSSSS